MIVANMVQFDHETGRIEQNPVRGSSCALAAEFAVRIVLTAALTHDFTDGNP